MVHLSSSVPTTADSPSNGSNNSPAAATSATAAIRQVKNNTHVSSADDNDDESSSSSSYHDPSTNDLTLFTSAILLTADCMGTGILALPADVQTLGRGWGIGFLLLNLPINLYAGTILGWCALYVEKRILGHDAVPTEVLEECDDNDDDQDCNNTQDDDGESTSHEGGGGGAIEMKKKTKEQNKKNKWRKKGYSSVDEHDSSLSMPTDEKGSKSVDAGENKSDHMDNEESDYGDLCHDQGLDARLHAQHTDTATFDFVGMTSMLFDAPILPSMADEFVSDAFNPDSTSSSDGPANHNPHPHRRQITYKHPFTKVVLAIYYVNLFLVLGNYILVMSHAVSAMAGENNLCIPTAGIVACTLMFAISQLRTMANLGRSVSAMSLLALLIVVVQCLMSLEDVEDLANNAIVEEEIEEYESYTTAEVALAKMSSLAAIGFAVGSQKLLLNIRHEMADRTKAAPGSLSIALSIYGVAYITVCILAGDQPPSFLFDAIPSGLGRQIAGFLLWVHVAVSYAINSQALCSSVDRIVGHRVKFCGLDGKHKVRWGVLTACVALSSYVVANAIPFFKDLVALCGAATSIPLTLLIPAIFYRRVQQAPLFWPTIHTKYSFLLVVFSFIFMLIGLIGAVGSIDVDWSMNKSAFACH